MNEKDERLLTALIDGEAGDGDRRGRRRPAPVDSAKALPPALLRRLAVLRALSDATRTHARRHRAPRSLGMLAARLAQQGASAGDRRARAGWFDRWNLGLAGAIASIAMVSVVVSVVVTTMVLGDARDEVAEAQLISAHLRSMMSPHTVDVASADSHTVKPWFSGRLKYAPPVEDFAAQGFVLVGGRLEVFQQEAVAALVYRHKQHLINLFVLPTKQAARLGTFTDARRDGFNLAARKEAEFTFIAVSDLNLVELNELLKLASATRG